MAEFNPRGPNVSDIINIHRNLLETEETLKQLFLGNSIIVANKRGKTLKELLSRANPYNIKSDLLDLNVHGYKKCGKNCSSCNILLMKPLLLYRMQMDGNIGKEE